MFAQTEDGCDRGDTTIAQGYIENHGAACTMKTDAGVSGVAIQLPALLRGKWATPNPNTGIETNFDDPATRANIHFSDQSLDAQWGGDISAVYGQGDYMGLSVGTSSCVRLNLN